MSNAKDLLGAPGADKPEGGKKRKMTAAIIEENEQKKEVYEFLEEDDDFEEFEIGDKAVDVEMASPLEKVEQGLWQVDWDDEEVDDDFAKQLRAQLAKTK